MTTKKKPRTGGDGASSNSLHGNDGSWGELSITAILRLGRELRKTIGADGTCLSPTRFADCGSGNIGCSLIGLPRVRLERGRTSSSRNQRLGGEDGGRPRQPRPRNLRRTAQATTSPHRIKAPAE